MAESKKVLIGVLAVSVVPSKGANRTDGQTDRGMDGQTNGPINGQMNGATDGQTSKAIDRPSDG